MVGTAYEETVEGGALLDAGEGEDGEAHGERDHHVDGEANSGQAWPKQPEAFT